MYLYFFNKMDDPIAKVTTEDIGIQFQEITGSEFVWHVTETEGGFLGKYPNSDHEDIWLFIGLYWEVVNAA